MIDIEKYNKTSLYEEHVKLEAKVVPFAGYLMPINYKKGISSEYHSVRNDVGMFDVSHMGQILVEGEKSEDFLEIVIVLKHKNSSKSALLLLL